MAVTLGNYPIVRKIGEGGMGRIYLVRDHDDTYWAAKEYKGDLAQSLLVHRFRREFRALQALEHPAIVKVKNLEYTQKQMFFLMEYINGTSMDQILRQVKARDSEWIKKVLVWMHYLCDPLHYIHSKNMVHRDLKPGNIMIMESSSNIPVKLLDFGVIHWSLADTILTEKHTFFGSLRYMAPEQIINETIDLRSDLYSFGVILYEATTGRPPFALDNPLLLMNQHQTCAPMPPRRLNPYISDHLENLILTLLFKRPDDRPSSATEIANWIDKILTDKLYNGSEITQSVLGIGTLFHPDFFGRDDEIKQLLHSWSLARNGEIQICTLSGNAGIGKTRLINRLLSRPEMASLPICRGEFFADGAIHSAFILALKSGIKILQNRKVLNILNSKPIQPIEILENQLKLTIEELEIKPNTSRASSNLQAKAAGILDALKIISDNQPLILVLDNIHFAGTSDIILLKNILEQYEIMLEKQEQKGVFFILAFKPEPDSVSDPLDEFLDWLNESTYRVDIQLEGLSEQAVTDMIRSMLGRTTVTSLTQSIFRESGGNPLLVIELVKNLQEQLTSKLVDELDLDQETLAVHIDDRLIYLLVKRLDRLAIEAKEVLMASAVLGIIFRADELEQASDIPDYAFLDQLDLLIRNRILEEDIYQKDSYRFTHAQLQETMLKKIPKPTAVELHRRCITVLEKLHKTNLGAVAPRLLHHSINCEWTEKIIEYRLLSAINADQVEDLIEAKNHLEHAIALFSSIETKDEKIEEKRFRVQLLFGSLLFRTGLIEEAEKMLKDTLEELEALDLVTLTSNAHKHLGALYGSQGKIHEALQHLNTCLALSIKQNNIATIIDCYTNIGGSYHYSKDYNNATKYVNLALEKSKEIGDDIRYVTSMVNLGCIYITDDKCAKDGLPYLERAINILEVIQNDTIKAYALSGIATHYTREIMHNPLANTHLDHDVDYYREIAEKVIDLAGQVIKITHKTGSLEMLEDALFSRAIAKFYLNEDVMDDLNRAWEISQKLCNEINSDFIITFKNVVLLKKEEKAHDQ